MKLMDRYIVRELIVPFLAGSLTIALLFDANQLIFILKTFNVQNVPILAMAQLIMLRTPFWLNMTLPAGIALAASLALTRMARESEITAMRACGVRVIRILFPVAVFGLVVAIGNYFLVEKVIPRAELRARRLEIEIGVAAATPQFNSNVWINLQQYRATFGSVTREGEDTLLIRDIVLGERTGKDNVQWFFADVGRYSRGVWSLENPVAWMLTPSGPKVTRAVGKSMTIQQPIFIADLFEMAQPQDKTATELVESIRVGKAAGRDMSDQEIALHTRYSVPASCIVFALVSPVFAIRFARTGGFVGVLLSFILVLLYYNAFVVSTQVFGKQHWVSPFMAAWLPNLLFLGLGVLGARRLE